MRVRFESRNFENVFLAPDDGANGTGGSGEGTTATAPPPTAGTNGEEVKYSEAELQRRIATSQKHWRKGMQKDLADKEEQIKTMGGELASLKTQLEEWKATHPGSSTAIDTTDGKIELLEKKHQRQIDDLKKQVEDANKARGEAEEKSRLTRRDTLLNAAIAKAGSNDALVAYRFFLPDVVWDGDEESWMLKTRGEGNLIDLDTGVREQMPDFLRPANVQNGGSGAKTGSPSRRQAASELETAEKKLETLSAELRRNPKDVNLTDQFMQQRKKVKILRETFSSTK